MRAVIIGNGTIRNYDSIFKYIHKDDFIICADGGIRHAVKMEIVPDLIIGDFDSLDVIKYDIKRIVCRSIILLPVIPVQKHCQHSAVIRKVRLPRLCSMNGYIRHSTG